MATAIADWELRSVLANPAELYAAITSWSHFRARTPVIEGDNELVITDMVARGCMAAACLVHSRREAFLMLLKPEDAQAFQERLGGLLFEMNSLMLAETMSRPRMKRF